MTKDTDGIDRTGWPRDLLELVDFRNVYPGFGLADKPADDGLEDEDDDDDHRWEEYDDEAELAADEPEEITSEDIEIIRERRQKTHAIEQGR